MIRLIILVAIAIDAALYANIIDIDTRVKLQSAQEIKNNLADYADFVRKNDLWIERLSYREDSARTIYHEISQRIGKYLADKEHSIVWPDFRMAEKCSMEKEIVEAIFPWQRPWPLAQLELFQSSHPYGYQEDEEEI